MEEFKEEDGKTYRLEALITNCICEICDDVRMTGCEPYESIVSLDLMEIGSTCGACSEEEAIDSAGRLCWMFHRGELGARPETCFTPVAIAHVRRRRSTSGCKS